MLAILTNKDKIGNCLNLFKRDGSAPCLRKESQEEVKRPKNACLRRKNEGVTPVEQNQLDSAREAVLDQRASNNSGNEQDAEDSHPQGDEHSSSKLPNRNEQDSSVESKIDEINTNDQTEQDGVDQLTSTQTQPGVSHGEESAQTTAQSGNPRAGRIKKVVLLLLLLIFLIGGSILGTRTWQFATSHQETEDAYVTGHLHQISARVTGTVQEVLVSDNEHVKKGQVIAILDPTDFQVKVDQARAKLQSAARRAEADQVSIQYQDTTAKGTTTTAHGGVASATAKVSSAEAAVTEAKSKISIAESQLAEQEAELIRARADFERYKVLKAEGAISSQQLDVARRDYEVAINARSAKKDGVAQANSQLDQAVDGVRTARAQLRESEGKVELAQAAHVQTHVNVKQFDVSRAAITEAEAALKEAELELSYTKILAPEDGRIGKKTVEVGQRVQPGQTLLSVVSDEMWVVANFKETQLENMRSGQEVEIKIDSFPHHPFRGRVLNFSPGSGATFALLPPDNATGNFTKIVQRIPVKVVFDSSSVKGFENRIVPGMSVIVTVDVKDDASKSLSTVASGRTGI
ncbi:MAG: HlyD family secretion protein [Cyanobacteria bacterium]|nr:HlyD family secretion protein [Cyanobacteriota bacterium]